MQGTRAVVTTYLLGGKVKTKYVAINAKGKGSVTVAFKKSKVRCVEVTLVNASIRFTNCYVKQHAVLLLGQADRPEEADLGARQGRARAAALDAVARPGVASGSNGG